MKFSTSQAVAALVGVALGIYIARRSGRVSSSGSDDPRADWWTYAGGWGGA